jgi:hypothetical protein
MILRMSYLFLLLFGWHIFGPKVVRFHAAFHIVAMLQVVDTVGPSDRILSVFNMPTKQQQ